MSLTEISSWPTPVPNPWYRCTFSVSGYKCLDPISAEVNGKGSGTSLLNLQIPVVKSYNTNLSKNGMDWGSGYYLTWGQQ